MFFFNPTKILSILFRSLTQSLDRCKRKYQTRLKRMEQQLKELSMKPDTESTDKILVPETIL